MPEHQVLIQRIYPGGLVRVSTTSRPMRCETEAFKVNNSGHPALYGFSLSVDKAKNWPKVVSGGDVSAVDVPCRAARLSGFLRNEIGREGSNLLASYESPRRLLD